MVRAFTKKIAVHGIGMGVFQFLRILWEEDGLTQSELAARARMKGPSAVAAIKELEWFLKDHRTRARSQRFKPINFWETPEGKAEIARQNEKYGPLPTATKKPQPTFDDDPFGPPDADDDRDNEWEKVDHDAE